MMYKLRIDPDISERLRAFISSDLFTIRSSIAKSEYWKHFGDQLQTNISRNYVEVSGNSGFYVPPPSSALKRIFQKSMRAIKQPAKAAAWLNRQIRSWFEAPRSMSPEKAFDSVMSHADVSVPIISPFTINHLKLAQHPGVFAGATPLKRHYRKWSGNDASGNIFDHYYYLNILRGFVNKDQISTVLDIGAGNGNLPSILYHDWGAPIRVILIDLPETLAVSIPYLSSLFPKAKIAMPNEIQSGGLPKDFDFAFLTVDQSGLLADSSIDLAINSHSFQEMTHEQIDVYFKLVQRVCRDSGFFFTANRVEKIPCGPDPFSIEQLDPPNRIAEYPWNQQNKTLVNEISRLGRLVQLDAISIRLEIVRK